MSWEVADGDKMLQNEVASLRQLLRADQQKVQDLERQAEHLRLGVLEVQRRMDRMAQVVAMGLRALRRANQTELADLLVAMLRGVIPEEVLLARPHPVPPPFTRPPEDSL